PPRTAPGLPSRASPSAARSSASGHSPIPAIPLRRQLPAAAAHGRGLASDSTRRAISTAVRAASSPTLCPPAGSERQRAWSRFSVVSTPNTTGTPVSSAACWMPRAHSPATYSKWAVSPRITQPMQITASAAPLDARVFATNGISNAPGTQISLRSPAATPHPSSPRRTPSRSRSVTWSLNRPHTTAIRRPAPSRTGGTRLAATSSRAKLVLLALALAGVRHRLERTQPFEEVPHALALGAQVPLVVRVGGDLERHPLDDLEPEALEAAVLGGVVGHHPHRGDPEVDEDLRADAVLAAVRRQPELQVGVHCVVALVLEAVRADLVPDADAASLVPAEVHDRTEVLLGDLAHRGGELRAAIAAQRSEHVAGQALAVHPHQHILRTLHIAAHERDVLLAVEHRLEHDAVELAELRGDRRLGDPAYELLVLAAVPDETRDRDQQQAVLVGEPLELGRASHVHLLVVDDLAQHTRRVQPREAGEVDGRLGVTGTLEHASFAGFERQDVTGAGEILRTGRGVDERLDRRGAVERRDPGAGVVPVVDRDEEGGALALGVLPHH